MVYSQQFGHHPLRGPQRAGLHIVFHTAKAVFPVEVKAKAKAKEILDNHKEMHKIKANWCSNKGRHAA